MTGKRIVLLCSDTGTISAFFLLLLTGDGLCDAGRCRVLYQSMALWFSGCRDVLWDQVI